MENLEKANPQAASISQEIRDTVSQVILELEHRNPNSKFCLPSIKFAGLSRVAIARCHDVRLSRFRDRPRIQPIQASLARPLEGLSNSSIAVWMCLLEYRVVRVRKR